MHTFAEKSKVSRQAASAQSTLLSRAHARQSRELNANVQRPLEANPVNGRGGPSVANTAHFGKDFSQIPLHAPSQGLSGKTVGEKDGADDAGGGTAVAASAPAPVSGGGGSAAGKTVDIYSVLLPGATRDSAADIARANTIWSQCSVKVNLSGGESWSTDLLDKLAPKKVLNEYASPTSPTQEELDLLDYHPGGKKVIHAYFVPAMSAGSRGESFLPSTTPNGVLALVISNSAAVDTLAHELGHVLLDDVGHHSDPDNLMASGSIRNVGVDKLDAAQCAKV